MLKRAIFIVFLMIIGGVSSQDQQQQEQEQQQEQKPNTIQQALIGFRLNLFGINNMIQEVLIGNNSNNQSTQFLIPNLTLQDSIYLYNNTCQLYNVTELDSNVSLVQQNLTISLQNMYLNCSGQFSLVSSDNNQTDQNNTNNNNNSDTTNGTTNGDSLQQQDQISVNDTIINDNITEESGIQNLTEGTQGLWSMNLIGLNVTINTTLFFNQTQNNTVLPQFRLMNTSFQIQNFSAILYENNQNISSNESTPSNITIPYSNSTLLILETQINEELNATVLRELDKLNNFIFQNLSELSIDENIKFYPSVNESQILSTNQSNLLIFISGFVYDIRYPTADQFQYDLETIDLSDQQETQPEENQQTTTTVTTNENQQSDFISTDGSLSATTTSSGTSSSVTTSATIPTEVTINDETFSINDDDEEDDQDDDINDNGTQTNETDTSNNNQSEVDVVVGSSIIRSILLRYLLSVNNFNSSYLNQKVQSEELDLESINIQLNDNQQLQVLKHEDQILRLTLNNYVLRIVGNTTRDGKLYNFNLMCTVNDQEEPSDAYVTLLNGNKTNNQSTLTIYYPQISVGQISLNIDDDDCEVDVTDPTEDNSFLADLAGTFIENFALEEYLEEVQQRLNENVPSDISDEFNQNINEQWNPIEIDRLETQIWLSLKDLIFVNDQNQMQLAIDFLVSKFVQQSEQQQQQDQEQQDQQNQQ